MEYSMFLAHFSCKVDRWVVVTEPEPASEGVAAIPWFHQPSYCADTPHLRSRAQLQGEGEWWRMYSVTHKGGETLEYLRNILRIFHHT